jgi:hypothetical protein
LPAWISDSVLKNGAFRILYNFITLWVVWEIAQM